MVAREAVELHQRLFHGDQVATAAEDENSGDASNSRVLNYRQVAAVDDVPDSWIDRKLWSCKAQRMGRVCKAEPGENNLENLDLTPMKDASTSPSKFGVDKLPWQEEVYGKGFVKKMSLVGEEHVIVKGFLGEDTIAVKPLWFDVEEAERIEKNARNPKKAAQLASVMDEDDSLVPTDDDENVMLSDLARSKSPATKSPMSIRTALVRSKTPAAPIKRPVMKMTIAERSWRARIKFGAQSRRKCHQSPPRHEADAMKAMP